MFYPDSRWLPRCQGNSRDDASRRIATTRAVRFTHVTIRFDSVRSRSDSLMYCIVL